MNIRLGEDPIDLLIGALMALLLGLLNALPIGIVVYVAVRLALPRELFTKRQEDCGSGKPTGKQDEE
ncbi:MAG TPA: hypothetical protein ENK37_08220 [Oceanithermus profundus]|uniref:Uncharacterized protein n=1 Tax=Oceanithermus profundus TaxID=187137 RepID=A0A7C4ZHH0_9DEIN|nr:hypothetical protein [Oceanithermus profundus]